MTFQPPDFVRVRYDALLIIGPKLTEANRIKLAPYLGKTGWVREVINREVKVFFPSMGKSAWFDNDILEESI